MKVRQIEVRKGSAMSEPAQVPKAFQAGPNTADSISTGLGECT